MSPCLVQQLFRQKIGKELDEGIVDEVLFPMLFKQMRGPRDLLSDIKMTQRWGKNGGSIPVSRVKFLIWENFFCELFSDLSF